MDHIPGNTDEGNLYPLPAGAIPPDTWSTETMLYESNMFAKALVGHSMRKPWVPVVLLPMRELMVDQ